MSVAFEALLIGWFVILVTFATVYALFLLGTIAFKLIREIIDTLKNSKI